MILKIGDKVEGVHTIYNKKNNVQRRKYLVNQALVLTKSQNHTI